MSILYPSWALSPLQALLHAATLPTFLGCPSQPPVPSPGPPLNTRVGVRQLNMEERQKAIEAPQQAHSAPLSPQQSSFVLWFWLLQLGPAGYCLGWAPVPTSLKGKERKAQPNKRVRVLGGGVSFGCWGLLALPVSLPTPTPYPATPLVSFPSSLPLLVPSFLLQGGLGQRKRRVNHFSLTPPHAS